MTDDIIRCQCPTVHGPPLFFCGGKLAPGETICAWCKSGHSMWLSIAEDVSMMPKPIPHEILIGDLEACEKPGDGYVLFGFLHPGFVFKPLRIEPVEGIDYSAFKFRGIWIGQYLQWADEWKELRTAEEIFKFDVPMTTIQTGLDCTIQFINVSKKAQPFAVKLVGRLVR